MSRTAKGQFSGRHELMPGRRRPALRDADARNALAVQWLGLVGWVIKRLPLRRLDRDDAEQAGRLGLLRAAELYDASQGTRFNTFAVWWIRQAILRAEQAEQLIAVPVALGCSGKVAAALKRQRRPRKKGQPGAKPSLAERLEAAARAARVTRIAVGPGDATGRDEPAMPEAGHDGPDPDALAALARALRLLTPRERRVLHDRFSRGLALSETGAGLGLTKERVRQIQAKALARLREEMGRDCDA